MPNQDNPNQQQTSQSDLTAGSFASQTDLPPMPTELQNGGNVSSVVASPNTIIAKPRGKFGKKKKIIAAILGVIVIVGGIGAGIILTQQPQILEEEACDCTPKCQTTPARDDQMGAGEESGVTCSAGDAVLPICCYHAPAAVEIVSTPTPTIEPTPTPTLEPTPTATPSSTPTATTTATPTPISSGEPNSCGGTCGSNSNCGTDFYCYNGYCRNPSCPANQDCNCSSPTPTPTQAALPQSGVNWPSFLGMGIGTIVIIGSLLLLAI